MAEWVNVFEKAVLDMKAEGLNVEFKSIWAGTFSKIATRLSSYRNVCW